MDPVYFAKTYYVGPREGGESAYKALQTPWRRPAAPASAA